MTDPSSVISIFPKGMIFSNSVIVEKLDQNARLKCVYDVRSDYIQVYIDNKPVPIDDLIQCWKERKKP